MITLFRQVMIMDPTAADGLGGPVDVLVDGTWITSVAPVADPASVAPASAVPPDARVIEGHGSRLLLPGLINAHFHSPANHLKGSVRSLPLELFMLFESPSDERLTPDPREAYLRTALGAIEMLGNGVTSVQDDAFLMPTPQPEIIDAVAQAYLDCGLRATVALDQPELPESAKQPFVDELRAGLGDRAGVLDQPAPAPAPELLAAYQHLIGTWHTAGNDLIRAAVSISAPQRVSPDYFAALDDLAEAHRLPLFAHMLETKPQRTLMSEQQRFGGRSLVDYTDRLGLLKPYTNVIHAVWVDAHDLDLIAAAGAVIAHNPVSNLRLGSGVMPWRAVLDRDITVALGTDEAICDDAINLWSVIKTAGLIHNVTGADAEDWPSPAEILRALWEGGAAAQGRAGELGVVAAGRLADLTLVDLRSIAFTPLNDLEEQLVHCEDGRDVVCTMVNGRIVAEGGRVSNLDQETLLEEARDVFGRKRASVRAARRDAEQLLPAYRRLVATAAVTDVGFSRWVGR